jgi:DNA-binding CsgD family transcriptional regulator
MDVARGDPNALAILAAMRGGYLIVQGRMREALESLDLAEAASDNADLPSAVERYQALSTAVRLAALADIRPTDVDRLAHAIPAGDSLFVMSHHLPYLYARGQRPLAELRLRAFRLAAQAVNHQYRLADAALFAAAERAPNRPLETPPLDSIPRWNWLARWRTQLLRFRAAHLREAPQRADEELRALGEAQAQAGDADLDGIGAFVAYHQAQSTGGQATVELALPKTVHLLNLPAVLAGAEALALAGSQALAARWLAWLQEELPPWVQTSLEWPVSRARIEALLALRSGALRGADASFEQAIAWAAEADYPCELAAAQIQWAEFRLHHSGSPGRVGEQHRTMREQAWDALSRRGVAPARFAYEVARLSAWTRSQSLHPHLTPRELEVLALLADGLTYKAIADRLGVKWPTIQVLSHHCYEKLGVSGKGPAVQTARDLGIL